MIDTSRAGRHDHVLPPSVVYGRSAPPSNRRGDIPPAFYRDDVPPSPPPDDPHWFEWSHDRDEPLPRWLTYGLPALLLFAAICHFVLLLIVLNSSSL